jgi:predicted ATPase
VKKEDDFDMETFLEKCVEDGYLISIDDTKKFAWTHDQVHQAAYELIPIAQRESFHLLLGSRLLMKSSSQEQGELLFYVVDNMNRGLKLLESSAQKYELSFLNLRAGERGKWMFVNAISALHSLFSVTNSLVLSFHDLFSYFIFSISLRIKILHHRFIIA